MVGAPAVGAFIAFWAFWVLLAIGFVRRDLGVTSGVVFVIFWLAGFVGLRSVLSGLLIAPYIAVLDVALVFAIFEGDVRIT